MAIHPTAVVDSRAEIGRDVEIGAYAIVEPRAVIGDRTRVMAHAYVGPRTEVGSDCEIHIAAVVGHDAQVRGATGPGGGLTIGARNIIREHVTIHRARFPEGRTVIGDDNYLMAYCHVAHDCRIGNATTVSNAVLLAGCVAVDDRAFISGNLVVHQHSTIGTLSMVGGIARGVSKDVPPFMLVASTNEVWGVNVVGLRRAGVGPETRQTIRRAYGILYRSGLSIPHALERLRELTESREVRTIVEFIERSTRGVCQGHRSRRAVRPS